MLNTHSYREDALRKHERFLTKQKISIPLGKTVFFSSVSEVRR